MKRQRLSLQNLEQSSRFYLHRQFISTGTGRDEDPVQLIFPDNSTTIGFPVHSIDQVSNLNGPGAHGRPASSHETTDVNSDRVVVYASLSDSSRIRHVSGPYRVYVMLLTCIQILLVSAVMFGDRGDTALFSSVQKPLKDCFILLLGSLSSLLALRRAQPFSFFSVSLMNSVGTLIAVYDGYLVASQPVMITCRILSIFVAITQWYINDLLYEIHSAQVFLLKKED